ncbi:MAG TPA: hypothetical protein VKG84_14565 [Candidatus Acidoferrales bacterium]|nr:hypothetical protein [Candidatus Acidoferrales bacterium]
MAKYDIGDALIELNEDALLPHPVRLRDMILRTELDPEAALDVNREFQSYLAQFGEAQKTGREILKKLAAHRPKQA